MTVTSNITAAAMRKERHLSRKRSVIQILAVAAFLVVARLSFDLVMLTDFIYRKPVSNPGLLWFVAFPAFLFLMVVFLIFVIVLAVRRLLQRHFLTGVVLIALCCIPFVIPLPDGPYWKFRVNRAAYLSTIQADSS